jgi:hypothetical protein
MHPDSVRVLLARVEEMRVSVADMTRVVSAEAPEADQRYLSRCCDLLRIELTAIREYIEHLDE